MSDNNLPVDIKVDSGIKYNVDKKEIKKIYDTKIIPRFTNKVEEIGRLRKKTFLIECDGEGKLNFRELKNPYKEIEELGRLTDKGLLTKEEFESKKKDILNRI